MSEKVIKITAKDNGKEKRGRKIGKKKESKKKRET